MSAFSFFMWGLADDIALPIVVLQRTRVGTYLDPAVIYRPPLSLVRHCSGSKTPDKLGLYLHLGYAELLRWLDADDAPLGQQRVDPLGGDAGQPVDQVVAQRRPGRGAVVRGAQPRGVEPEALGQR